MLSETRLCLVNLDTGEVVREIGEGCDITVRTSKQRAAALRSSWKNAMAVRKFLDNPEGSRKDEPFIWFRCCRGAPLPTDLGNADLVRLFFLATFMNYDGVLACDKHPLTVKRCADLLGISYGVTNAMINRLIDTGMFTKSNGVLKMKDTWFYKGGLTSRWARTVGGQPASTVRIYCDALRRIYSQYPAKNIGNFSYILRLIPYLRREPNTCCLFPAADDIGTAMPMTANMAARLLGVSSGNYAWFRDILTSPALVLPDGSPAVSQTKIADMYDDKQYIFLNPNLVYGGQDATAAAQFGGFGVKELTTDNKGCDEA